MIAAGLALLNERQPFPGWLAIPPTLGTALVILAGRCGEKRLSLLLSVRPMVAVGLISYSAYLWHWPMFALYRYGYGRVSIEAGAVMLVATLVLSWMSYRYVEQPARRSKAEPMRIIARFYAAPAAALLVVTATALYPDRVGIAIHSEGYRRRLESLRSKTQSPNALYSACQRPRILPSDVVDPRCVMGAPSAGPPGAILWGDSNAVHYVGMIDVFARTAGFRFRNIEVGTCPPIFSDPAPYARATRVADCRASTEVIRPALDDYPVIIVASSWTLYQRGTKGFLEDFYETASALTRANKTVIIIGKVPFVRGYDRRCRERALSYPFLHCRDGEFDLPPDIAATNAELRRFAESNPNIHYFDATEYLCPNGRCRVLRDNGDPWYFDTSHLTLAASYELGEKIVAREGVPAMFTAITHTAGSGTR